MQAAVQMLSYVRNAITLLFLLCTLAALSARADVSIVNFSKFVGTQGNDAIGAVALDRTGNIFVAGTSNRSQGDTQTDAFVVKLTATGELVYLTYIGGSADDSAIAIAIDSAGRPIVAGNTKSNDFPVTADAIQKQLGGGQDAFLARLDLNGSILFSTYLGGTGFEALGGMAVDHVGNSYLAGGTHSVDFPVSANSVQPVNAGSEDAFLALISPSGSLTYSSYIGGPGQDVANGVTIDESGNLFVTGFAAIGFPTTSGSYRPSHSNSPSDAFVMKLASDGGLLFSTYLGAGANSGTAIAVDQNGNPVVVGLSAGDFSVTADAVQGTYRGGGDVFVAKLNSVGSSVLYATYVGGSNRDEPSCVFIGPDNSILLGGYTYSADYPTTPGATQTLFVGGPTGAFSDFNNDGFVTQIDSAGSIKFSSLLGGYGTDSVDGIFLVQNKLLAVGATAARDFPTMSGSAFHGGEVDGFVVSIDRVPAYNDLSRVVEFFEPTLGHYFITANPNEQAFIDTGAVGNWLRTGNVFITAGSQPVCRFYGNDAVDPLNGKIFGPNSHFYTADPAECSSVKALFNPTEKSWRFEGNDFSTVAAENGCAAGHVAVYRSYNNGFVSGIDSNHRITTNKGAYDLMMSKGWIGEGAVMCAVR